ncbi:MAG: hypothetical protein PVI23_14925 [Maricaulaceae bacterium]
MKKLLIASVAVAALSTPAFAGGDIVFDLTGEIPAVCEIEGYDDNNHLDLDDTYAQQVALVEFTCNLPSGFTRTVSSWHGGYLVGPAGALMPYTIGWSGAWGLDTGDADLTSDQVHSIPGQLAFVNGETAGLHVNANSAGQFAGHYYDTITVEIAPN